MSRRRRGSSRPLLILLLVVVVLPLAVVGGVVAFVDPNSFKPRIVEAVRMATGRDLVLQGPLGIALSWSPTLKATDVSLANPPGFSRPQMATLGQVEAQLALWPLLTGRIEIVRLVLRQPDLMFETDANGHGNWLFAPMARPITDDAGTGQAKPLLSGTARTPGAPRFAVAAVEIDGGRLTWRDGRSGQSEVIAIGRLSANSAGAMAPISATATISARGHEVALNAETGPLEQLLGGDAASAGWPMQIVARVEGARLAASGTVERPMEGRGYQLTLDAAVPDLAPLGTLLGQPLPALRDVSASAKVSDATGVPIVSALMLRAGPSDLQASVAGLTLDRVEVSAPGLDQPMHAEVEGALAGTRLRIAASLGAPAMLLPSGSAILPGGGFPVDITAEAAGATLSAKGGIAQPATLRGLDVVLTARVPDLAALQPLLGGTLPALHTLAFDGRLSDGPGGYASGIVLHAMSLSGPPGDIAGDIAIGFTPRLSVQGTLSGKRLDGDMLQAAFRAPVSAPVPVPVPVPVPEPAAPVAGPAPAAVGPKRLISDRPIDLRGFDVMDADLQTNLAELRSGGVVLRDLSGHVVLNQGRLTLDPFSAVLPGGKLDLRIGMDTRVAEPPLTLSVNAPGIALKPMLTALGLPDDVTGSIEIAADISAAGRSPHALASTLTGKIGLVMTEGELDNRLLAATLGDVLRATRLPGDLVPGSGRTRLRCFATRIDASHGVATVAALVLDSGKVLVQGVGAINLGEEALALRLRPLLRTGGPGIVIPVRVTGSLASPNVAVDAGGTLEGVAGGLLGNIAGLPRNPLGALASAVGERGGDACGPALVAARGARPGGK